MLACLLLHNKSAPKHPTDATTAFTSLTEPVSWDQVFDTSARALWTTSLSFCSSPSSTLHQSAFSPTSHLRLRTVCITLHATLYTPPTIRLLVPRLALNRSENTAHLTTRLRQTLTAKKSPRLHLLDIDHDTSYAQ